MFAQREQAGRASHGEAGARLAQAQERGDPLVRSSGQESRLPRYQSLRIGYRRARDTRDAEGSGLEHLQGALRICEFVDLLDRRNGGGAPGHEPRVDAIILITEGDDAIAETKERIRHGGVTANGDPRVAL